MVVKICHLGALTGDHDALSLSGRESVWWRICIRRTRSSCFPGGLVVSRETFAIAAAFLSAFA